ncbi:MAG: hypothetical protein QW069_09085 [Candidatus Caldarchaeum sp.]
MVVLRAAIVVVKTLANSSDSLTPLIEEVMQAAKKHNARVVYSRVSRRPLWVYEPPDERGGKYERRTDKTIS